MNHHHFEGKDIPHIKLNSKTTVKELVEIYANSGFNARQLGEAAKLYQKMIHENATICLTVAGAMTPVGIWRYYQNTSRERICRLDCYNRCKRIS